MSYKKIKDVLALIANGKKTLQGKGLIERVAKKAGLTIIETRIEMKGLLDEKLIDCDWSHGTPVSLVTINLPIPDKLIIKNEWQAEVDKQLFPGDRKKLRVKPILIDGRSHHEVISAFAKLPEFINSELFLREVSTRLFWGASKILDSKEALVAELLGLDSSPFPEKPLSINVHISCGNINGILFIENEISFLAACKNRIKGAESLILIFASGFKSGTPRIRNKINTSVFYSSASVKHDKIIIIFEKWLAGDEALFMPFFWGDLDFSGMAILSSLKKVFPTIKAWKTGYDPMLCMLESGGGHTPKEAGKDNQDDPSITGCDYADKVLLPLLRSKKRFLDQE